jgi:hypothetical protein
MAVRINRHGGGSKRRDEEDEKKKSTATKQTNRNTPSISNVKPITSAPVRTQDQPKRNVPSIADVKPIQNTAKQSQTKGSTVAKATVPFPVKKTDEKTPKVEVPIMEQLTTEHKWENPLLKNPPVIPTKPKYTTSDVRDKYDPTEKNAITKFTVKPVTTNVYDTLVNGVNPPKPTAQNPNPEPVVEMWYLKDGDDMLKVAEYSAGVKEIGRERLVGITENDRVVMYNKITGEIYKFSQPDEEYRNARVMRDTYELKLNNLSQKADMAVADYEAQIKEYEAKLNKYKERMESGEQLSDADYAELQALYEEGAKIEVLRDHALITYNTAMQEALAKYDEARTALSSKGMSMEEWHTYKLLRDKADNSQVPLTREENIMLSELHKRVESGATTVYATDDYFNKLAASADTVDTIRSEYEEYMKYFSDSTSDTQVNSLLDVVRRISARTIFKQDLGTTVGDDISELVFRTVVAPFAYAAKTVENIKAVSKEQWEKEADELLATMDAPEHIKERQKAIYVATAAYSDTFLPALQSIWSVMLNNTLVGGEILDYSNVLKPWVVGSAAFGHDELENEQLRELNERTQAKILSGEATDDWIYKIFPPASVDDIAGWEAVKSFWGANGTFPNYELDMLVNEEDRTGPIKLLCFIADIVIDPGTWLGGGGKAALDAVDSDKLVDSLRTVYKNADIPIPDTKEANALLRKQADWMFKRALFDKNTALEATLPEAVERMRNKLSTPDGVEKYLNTYATKNSKEAIAEAMQDSIERLQAAALEESKLIPSKISTAYDVIQSVQRVQDVDKALTKLMFASAAPVPMATIAVGKALKKTVSHIRDIKIANRALVSVQRVSERVSTHFDEVGAVAKDLRVIMQEVDDELAHVLTAGSTKDSDSVKFLHDYRAETFRALTDSVVAKDLQPVRDIMHSAKSADKILADLDTYVAKNINGYDDFVSWYSAVLKNRRVIEHYSPGAAQLVDVFKQEYRTLVATRNFKAIERGVIAYQNNIKFINDALGQLSEGGKMLNLITPAQRDTFTKLHNAIKGMADSFNPTYAPELAQEYKQLAAAIDTKLKAMGDSAYTIFEISSFEKELNDFIDVVNRYTTKVSEYASDLRFKAYTPVQYNEYAVVRHADETAMGLDEVASAIQRVVERTHGVTLSHEEIMNNVLVEKLEDIVVKGGELDLEDISRIYTLIPSKYTVVNEYLNNDAMRQVADSVLDVNSQANVALKLLRDEINSAIDALEHQKLSTTLKEAQRDAIDGVVSDLMAQRNTKNFVDTLNKELQDIDAGDYSRAFMDAYVGNSANTINHVFNNMTGLGDVTYTVDRITDDIVENATKFINGIDDVQYTKLFDKRCNTLDTEANVRTLMELVKKERVHTEDGVFKTVQEIIAEDSNKYIDVLYSTDASIKNADPFMVSFAVDGDVQTFRNADVSLTAKSNTFELYGISHENALRYYEEVSQRVEGLSAGDYVIAVDDYFAKLYERAAKEGKQVRFIGFNNCAAGTGQERAITKFARDNGLGIHISSQIDVANFLRAEKGIKSVPKEAVAGLRRAVHSTVINAHAANTTHRMAAGLVMDTSVDYTHLAELIGLAAKDSADINNIVDAMLNNLVTAYRAVGYNNANVGSGSVKHLINEHALCDMINRASDNSNKVTRVNCMRMIYDACKTKNYDLNLKTRLNIEYIKNWFDVDELTQNIGNFAVSSYLDTASTVVQKLDNFHNSINNPALLNDIGKEAYEKLFDLVTMLISASPIAANFVDVNLVKSMALDTAQDYHSVLMYLRKEYGTLFPTEEFVQKAAEFRRYSDDLFTRLMDAFATTDVDTANTIVYNKAHVVNRNRYQKLLMGKYSSATAKTTLAESFEQTLDYAYKRNEEINTYAEYLGVKTAMAETLGIMNSQDYIHHALFQQVTAPYRDLIDTIESMVPRIRSSAGKTSVEQAQSQFARNEAMSKIQQHLMKVQEHHATEAVKTVLALSDDDFVTHVVRNAFNALLIDPNTKALQDVTNNTALFNKLYRLQSSGKLVVEQIDAVTGEVVTAASKGTNRTYIRVYKDLTGLTDEAKDALFKQYNNATVDLYKARLNIVHTNRASKKLYDEEGNVIYDRIKDAYEDYLIRMHNYMPDSYAVSTMETMTQETMQSIQQFFPENARLDLNRFNSWFDEGFNCSLLGDRNIHTQFNMYASDNIINNMGMGINHVRNKLEATTNYLALFDNPTQSLRHMLETTQSLDMGVKDIKKALESRGYVLTTSTYKDGVWSVHELTLDTAAQLQAYVKNDRVICVPREVMYDIQEYTKGVNKQWKIDHANAFQKGLINMADAYQRKIRSARMVGYLFLPFMGPAVRNFFDANIKGFNEVGSSYFSYAKNALEYYHRYEDIVSAIMEDNSAVTAENIAKYFDGNVSPLLDKDTFMKLHGFYSSTAAGLVNFFKISNKHQTAKLLGLLPEGSKVNEEMLQSAQEIFESVYAKYGKRGDDYLATMRGEAHKRLSKLGYDEKTTAELADLFYNYTPSSTDWERMVKNTPYIGDALYKYMVFNQDMFSAGETISRTAMAMYYMEECAYTVSQANERVIATQFNYNARGKLMQKVETLMPFSTFKIYNAKYWLTEAPKKYSTMHNISRYTKLTGAGYDSDELTMIIRNAMLMDKIRSGELTADEEGNLDEPDGIAAGALSTMYHTIPEIIEDYKGMPSRYATGIRLGDNHVLKLGNSFVDALDFMYSSLLAPFELANGHIPTILGDNVYSPLATLISGINAYIRNGGSFDGEILRDEQGNVTGYTGFVKWMHDNYYDIIDIVPFYGALANTVITHLKNGNINLPDMVIMNCVPELKKEFVKEMYENVLRLSGTVMPSLVGTIYDSEAALHKPIGYDWYDQTEEYRNTHRYVFGVSYFGSYFSKDPATYVDYTGKLKKLGYSDEEVSMMLEFMYGGTEKPGMYKYDSDLVEYTLNTLVDKGYTVEEAIELIMSGTKWVDPITGEVRADAEVMSTMLNSAFLARYDLLPDYIKYDKNQYSMLKEYYKNKGYTTEQAWLLMSAANGYIDEQGRYRELTPEQAAAYNKQINDDYLEFMDGLPDWYKYEPGAATRTVNALIAQGMTLQQARAYILQNNYYVGEDGVAYHFTPEESLLKTAQSQKEFNDYYSQLPDYLKYEKGAYSRTLNYLKQIGYDTDTAKEFIKNGAYYTVDGRLIDCTELERKRVEFKTLSDEEFTAYYSELPEYLRYEKGAFSRTYAHLKAQGYKYYEILELIKNGAYLTDTGELIDCRGMKRPPRGSYYSNKNYNDYKKYYRPKAVKAPYIRRSYVKKPYVMSRNYSSTYSKVNALAGASYGYRKVYKVDVRANAARKALSTKSDYPASYRNIVYAHRRNLYKELYAKYGTSRIIMRSNAYKTYSNACITRLRRNEIYNRVKYGNRRSSF